MANLADMQRSRCSRNEGAKDDHNAVQLCSNKRCIQTESTEVALRSRVELEAKRSLAKRQTAQRVRAQKGKRDVLCSIGRKSVPLAGKVWLSIHNKVLCEEHVYTAMRASYAALSPKKRAKLTVPIVKRLFAAGNVPLFAGTRAFAPRVNKNTFRHLHLPLVQDWFSVLLDPRLCVQATPHMGRGLFAVQNVDVKVLPTICGLAQVERDAAAERFAMEKASYAYPDSTTFLHGPLAIVNHCSKKRHFQLVLNKNGGTQDCRPVRGRFYKNVKKVKGERYL